jgi:autotransporter-associated beta strand protein
MRFHKWLLVFCSTMALSTTAVNAQQNLLPGAIQPGTIQISLQTIATGLTSPVYATSAPGDPNDLFVVDQIGKIDVIHNGVLEPTPMLDITSLENAIPLDPSYDERGLLGLAFSPGFDDPTSSDYHTLYTYQSEAAGTAPADFAPAPGTLTGPIDHQNVLVQWKVGSSNPDVVDTTTRNDLLREDQPASNHNGGTIAFGPDGYLYLAIGDGGSANDSGNGHIASTGNAQSLSVIYGKMLRIDPNGHNSANGKYGIPPTNPFVNTPGALPEIYAYGLRNPYRFSFDPATGDLIEGDVGQNEVEEVNSITSGGNYGWPIKEGTFLFNRTGPNAGLDNPVNSPGSPPGLIDPILEYDHNDGNAVIGGFVYHGSKIPQLDGDYVFGDLSNGTEGPDGRLFYANLSSGQINEFDMSAPLGMYLKGFGEDANGEIYVMASAELGPTGNTGVVMEIVSNAKSLSWDNAGGAGNGATWDIGVNQNWNNGSGAATYADGSNVTFNDANNGHYNVTLNTTVTPNSVTVNNGSGNYTISGTGNIAGATTTLTKVGSGMLILSNTGVNTYGGGTTVSAGTLLIGAAGALPAASSVSITGGTLQLGASTGGETLSSLSITGAGAFDVNNNHVIISYAPGSQATADATIRSYLISGYNGGAWNGPGIDSSASAANARYGLGYADGADGVVSGLSSGQIEVKYTLYGDANLDGVVNGTDFGILAAHFGQQVSAWDEGDFTYGGVVNGTDFGLLAANFGQQANGAAVELPASDWTALYSFAAANGLMADVPEPASGAMVLMTVIGAVARRRRSCRALPAHASGTRSRRNRHSSGPERGFGLQCGPNDCSATDRTRFLASSSGPIGRGGEILSPGPNPAA